MKKLVLFFVIIFLFSCESTHIIGNWFYFSGDNVYNEVYISEKYYVTSNSAVSNLSLPYRYKFKGDSLILKYEDLEHTIIIEHDACSNFFIRTGEERNKLQKLDLEIDFDKIIRADQKDIDTLLWQFQLRYLEKKRGVSE